MEREITRDCRGCGAKLGLVNSLPIIFHHGFLGVVCPVCNFVNKITVEFNDGEEPIMVGWCE